MGRAKKKKIPISPGPVVTSALHTSVADPFGITKVFVSPWIGDCSRIEEDPEIPTGKYSFGAAVAMAFDPRNGDAAILVRNVTFFDESNVMITLCRVFRVTKEGEVSFLAGGIRGFADGRAENACFSFSRQCGDVAFDVKGNLIVSDSNNHALRYVTQNGTVTTIGGDCPFQKPAGLAVDTQGNIFVTDESKHCVYKFQIKSRKIHGLSIFAGGVKGNKDGLGEAARFECPSSICIDDEPSQNLFVLDTGLLRKISSEGLVSTVVNLTQKLSSVCSSMNCSTFLPNGIAVGGCGTLVVSFENASLLLTYTKAHTMSILLDYRGKGHQQRLASASGGMAIDRHGNVLLCSFGRIQKVKAGLTPLQPTKKRIENHVSVLETRTSGFEEKFGSNGTCCPMAVDVDIMGKVLVGGSYCNSEGVGSSYLQLISPEGLMTLLAHRGPLMDDPDKEQLNPFETNPVDIAVSEDGSVYAVQGNSVLKVSRNRVVTTVAGTELVPGYHDGSGVSALFNNPRGVALNAEGNLIVADTANHCVRKIVQSGCGHIVSTLAGNGSPGYQDGIGTQAHFAWPKAVAVDSLGNIHVYDVGSSLIRTISPAGEVSSFAPDMMNSVTRFANLGGMVVDGDNCLIVSDLESGSVIRIERVASTISCGIITDASQIAQVYGHGFRRPQLRGLAVNRNGEVLVCDHANHCVLVVDAKLTAPKSTYRQRDTSFRYPVDFGKSKQDQPATARPAVLSDSLGNIYYLRISFDEDATKRCQVYHSKSGCTPVVLVGGVAGFKDGHGSRAAFNFNQHSDMVMDPQGNLIVSDSGNHAIRKVTPKGTVFTIAGCGGVPGYRDGLARPALFDEPSGVAVDDEGRIFVADTYNHCIRSIRTGKVGLLAVSTIAGTGMSGWKDGLGDTAQFCYPLGICIDTSGTFCFVADSMNHRIRRVHESKTAMTEYATVETLEFDGNVIGKRPGHDLHDHIPGPSRLTLDDDTDLIVSTLNGTLLKLASQSSQSGLSFNVEYISSYESTRIGTGPHSWHGPVIDGTGLVHMSISGETKCFFEHFATVSPPKLPARNDFALTFGQISLIEDLPLSTNFIMKKDDLVAHAFPMSIISDCVGNTYIAVQHRGYSESASSSVGLSSIIKIPHKGGIELVCFSQHQISRGSKARLCFKSGACMRMDGTNLIVAEVSRHSIRKVDTHSGIVTTLAGCGQSGYKDGIAEKARFNNPVSIAVDPQGRVFVSDQGNKAIRIIHRAQMIGQKLKVSTLVNNVSVGSIALDKDGNIFVVETNGSNAILRINTQNLGEGEILDRNNDLGYVSMLTISGCKPKTLAMNGDGELIVACQDGEIHQVCVNNMVNGMSRTHATNMYLEKSGTSAIFKSKAVTDFTIDQEGSLLICGLANGTQRIIIGLAPSLHFFYSPDVEPNAIQTNNEGQESSAQSSENFQKSQELKALFSEEVSLLNDTVLRHKDIFNMCANQKVSEMHPRVFQELWTQECKLPLKLQEVEHVNQLMTKQYAHMGDEQFYTLTRNLPSNNFKALQQWFEDREQRLKQRLFQSMQIHQQPVQHFPATSASSSSSPQLRHSDFNQHHQHPTTSQANLRQNIKFNSEPVSVTNLESGRVKKTLFPSSEAHLDLQPEIPAAPKPSSQSSTPRTLQSSTEPGRGTPDVPDSELNSVTVILGENNAVAESSVASPNCNPMIYLPSVASPKAEDTILTLLPGIQAACSPKKPSCQKSKQGSIQSLDVPESGGNNRVGPECEMESSVGDACDRAETKALLDEAVEKLAKSEKTNQILQENARKTESETDLLSQRISQLQKTENRLKEALDKSKRDYEAVRLEAAESKKRAQQELVGLKQKSSRELEMKTQEWQRQMDLKEKAMKTEIDLKEKLFKEEIENRERRAIMMEAENITKMQEMESRMAETLRSNRRLLGNEEDLKSLTLPEIRALAQDVDNSSMQIRKCLLEKELDAARKEAAAAKSEASLCCVCIENARDTVLNCGHLVLCNKCSSALINCPMCRITITTRIKIFT